MKKVVFLKIEEYDFRNLKKRIKDAIDEHFSGDLLIKPGDKVLLKPNLLTAASIPDAITTHPVLIEAVGSIYKDFGCEVSIADSPAALGEHTDIDFVYKENGIKSLCETHGFKLLYPNKSVVCGEFPLCWWAEPGKFKIVNLPKLKTHEITALTIAVKNLYGCIIGAHKSDLHRRNPRGSDLVKVILRLSQLINPAINIVDGIISLEGEGPAKKGKPIKLNIVAISDDALSLDWCIGQFLGLSDNAHPIIKEAKSQKILKSDEVVLVSELEDRFTGFKFPPPNIVNSMPALATPLVKTLIKFKPVINHKKCVGCKACKEACPTGAISMNQEKKAVIDYKKCIKCMCCQEVCRYGAVDLGKSLLLRILNKIR